MARRIEAIAYDLFNKIRTRFPSVTLGDEGAGDTRDQESARFFNFTYLDNNGEPILIDYDPKKPARITISLIDEKSLKFYYAQDIAKYMDDEQRLNWYAFIRSIRKFAKRNGLRFDVRDLELDGLELQDVKQQAKTDDVATSDEVKVMESKLYGRAGKPKLSIGEHGATKILVFHSEKVDEEKRGSRTRKVECIFLETPIGERLKLETKSLPTAYAMAEHFNQGGSRDDERGCHIMELSNKVSALRRFVRLEGKRQFEDETTSHAVEKAVQDYKQTRNVIKRMSHPRYYLDYFNEYAPTPVAEITDEEISVVREKFARKVYDERIEEALPIIAREIRDLEEWANDVTESTWLKPNSNDKVEALQDLLNSPLTSSTASDKLKHLIGSDELNDALEQYLDQPDYDVRGIVKKWLQHYMPDLATKISYGQNNGSNDKTNWVVPTTPEVKNDEYGDSHGGRGDGSWNITF